MFGELVLDANLNTAKGQDILLWIGESKSLKFMVSEDLQAFDITWRVGSPLKLLKTAVIEETFFTISLDATDYDDLEGGKIYPHEVRLVAAGDISVLAIGHLKLEDVL